MKQVLIALLATLLLLAGCGPSPQHEAVYGDDAKIADKNEQYVASNYKGSQEGNTYTITGNITGARTVWHQNVEEPTALVLQYSLSVSSGGKAKLVLVSPSGQVATIAENTSQSAQESPQEVVVNREEPGEYALKLVATEDAKVSVSLTVPEGEFGEPGH